MSAEDKLDRYRIRVLDRTFELLDLLAASDSPLTASDLCNKSHLSKSTVHRLLTVLEARRVVERQGETHAYRVGSKLAELARHFEREETLGCPQASLDRLADRTGGTVRLGVLHKCEEISLLFTSQRSLRYKQTQPAVRMPIHCTALGKALVAFEPFFLGELLPYYRFDSYTTRTITAPSTFRAELKKVQSSGFAYDNEEFRAGFRCIAAPVRDARGRVVAAVSVSGTTAEISPGAQAEIMGALRAAAQELSPIIAFIPSLHS